LVYRAHARQIGDLGAPNEIAYRWSVGLERGSSGFVPMGLRPGAVSHPLAGKTATRLEFSVPSDVIAAQGVAAFAVGLN